MGRHLVLESIQKNLFSIKEKLIRKKMLDSLFEHSKDDVSFDSVVFLLYTVRKYGALFQVEKDI